MFAGRGRRPYRDVLPAAEPATSRGSSELLLRGDFGLLGRHGNQRPGRQFSLAVDEVGIDLGMGRGKAGTPVHSRWISRKPVDAGPGSEQAAINRKRSSQAPKAREARRGVRSKRCAAGTTEERWTDLRPNACLSGQARRFRHRQGRKVPGWLTGGRAAQGMTPGSTEAQADRLPGVPPRVGA